MKLFFSYIKSHIALILMYALFISVFLLVSLLYSINMEPVLYSALLCSVFAAIAVTINFFSFRSKHKTLTALKSSIVFTLSDMPVAHSVIENDYNELIRLLYSEKKRIQTETAMTVSDMNDYYTLWAHQIKTPIAAMRLLLQSSDSQHAELDEQLFKIEQYVEMVLTYLRTDSDATDYVLGQYSLDTIIKGALKKYAKLFIRKKISLEYEGTDITVTTDEKWLSFVLEQVLSNALKYTSEGKITVRVNSDKHVIIEDTGIGIAAEDLPRIFEKGYTGYNGRADKKSTGIGLYLCRRILEKLSHSVSITSDVGKGTRVDIGLGKSETIYE